MQYILLLYGDQNVVLTEAEQQAQMDAHNAYTSEMRDRGAYVGGEALYPTTSATTVQVRDGKTLTTDGPFAETKEQLGGYYVVECKDLDEAIEWAAKNPESKHGSIEIRPLVVF